MMDNGELPTRLDLDSSEVEDSIRYLATCGPMTKGEKDYLKRKGLIFENSDGELYGEPSTLSFNEDLHVGEQIKQYDQPKELSSNNEAPRSIPKSQQESQHHLLTSDESFSLKELVEKEAAKNRLSFQRKEPDPQKNEEIDFVLLPSTPRSIRNTIIHEMDEDEDDDAQIYTIPATQELEDATEEFFAVPNTPLKREVATTGLDNVSALTDTSYHTCVGGANDVTRQGSILTTPVAANSNLNTPCPVDIPQEQKVNLSKELIESDYDSSTYDDASSLSEKLQQMSFGDLDDTFANVERMMALAELAEAGEVVNLEDIDVVPLSPVSNIDEYFPSNLPCSLNEGILAKAGKQEELNDSLLEAAEEEIPPSNEREARKSHHRKLASERLEEVVLSPPVLKVEDATRRRTKRLTDQILSGNQGTPTPKQNTASMDKGATQAGITDGISLFKTPAIPSRTKTPSSSASKKLTKSTETKSTGNNVHFSTPKGYSTIPFDISSPVSTIGYPTPLAKTGSKEVKLKVSPLKIGVKDSKTPSPRDTLKPSPNYRPTIKTMPDGKPINPTLARVKGKSPVLRVASPVAAYVYSTPVAPTFKRAVTASAGSSTSDPRKVLTAPRKVFPASKQIGGSGATGRLTVGGGSSIPVPLRTSTIRGDKAVPSEQIPLNKVVGNKIKPNPKTATLQKTARITPSPVSHVCKVGRTKPKQEENMNKTFDSPALIDFESPVVNTGGNSGSIGSGTASSFEEAIPNRVLKELCSQDNKDLKSGKAMDPYVKVSIDEVHGLIELVDAKTQFQQEQTLKNIRYTGCDKKRDESGKVIEFSDPIIPVGSTHGFQPIIITSGPGSTASKSSKENVCSVRHTGLLSESGGASIIQKEHVIKSFIPSRVGRGPSSTPRAQIQPKK